MGRVAIMTYEERAILELDSAIESTQKSTNRLRQIVGRLTSLPVRRDCAGDTRIMRRFKKEFDNLEAGLS